MDRYIENAKIPPEATEAVFKIKLWIKLWISDFTVLHNKNLSRAYRPHRSHIFDNSHIYILRKIRYSYLFTFMPWFNLNYYRLKADI